MILLERCKTLPSYTKTKKEEEKESALLEIDEDIHHFEPRIY